MEHRTRTKVNYDIFPDTCEVLQMGESQLCTLLGFGDTTWYGWRKSGKIPLVVALTCNYLIVSDDADILEEVFSVVGARKQATDIRRLKKAERVRKRRRKPLPGQKQKRMRGRVEHDGSVGAL